MSITRLLSKLENGFVNCHAHIDRAGTASFFHKEIYKTHLFEKWKLVKKVKEQSTTEDYYNRIVEACFSQREKDVSKIISFIDLDDIVGTKALDAAVRAREYMRPHGVDLYIGNQTVGGFTPRNLKLLEDNVEYLDFLGGLPKSDEDPERHLNILFNLSKQTNKKIHVHVDQMNTDEEAETYWLARRTIQAGLQGKVVAVHSISVACHDKFTRDFTYEACKDAGMQFVACPSAWIDHPRTERLSPTHNSITPIDELLKWDLTVGLGTDNIEDIYKPYCDGDMLFETRLALEACKIYDDETIIDIAHNNGLKILG
jgi:cytosine/creatinine deaminase